METVYKKTKAKNIFLTLATCNKKDLINCKSQMNDVKVNKKNETTQELVFQNEKGQFITTSLLVAEKFGKSHKHVLRDIKELKCTQTFHETNFGLIENQQVTHSPAVKSYHYEITKDGFTFLVMGYTGEKAGKFKEDYITAFNKMESLLKSDDFIMARALEIAYSRTKMLEEQARSQVLVIEQQSTEIERMKPRDEFVKRVFEAEDVVTMSQAAKLLKLEKGRNYLFALLREKGIIYKTGREPKQEYVNKGYFVLNEVEKIIKGKTKVFLQTHVTQKGLGYIAKVLNLVHVPEPKAKFINEPKI